MDSASFKLSKKHILDLWIWVLPGKKCENVFFLKKKQHPLQNRKFTNKKSNNSPIKKNTNSIKFPTKIKTIPTVNTKEKIKKSDDQKLNNKITTIEDLLIKDDDDDEDHKEDGHEDEQNNNLNNKPSKRTKSIFPLFFLEKSVKNLNDDLFFITQNLYPDLIFY